MFSFFSNGSESIPYGLLYLNRYLRMTPMLAIYMLVSMTLIRFMGNGPIWPISLVFLSDNCKRYWWSTLLHIQNYVNPGEIVRKKQTVLPQVKSLQFQITFFRSFSFQVHGKHMVHLSRHATLFHCAIYHSLHSSLQ